MISLFPSIAPPKGKHEGRGPEPASKTPPSVPTQPHHTPTPAPVGPGKAPGGQHPKRRGKEKEAGGHTKGLAGNHTRAPQLAGKGPQHTAPRQHRDAKTSAEGRGQAPKPTTNTPHTRLCAHTTHTATAATNTSPTNAHNTPKREHRPHRKRTQHRKTERTRAQQLSARGSAGPPETPLGHKGRPTSSTHQALSQEWRAPTPSNTQRPTTPKPTPRTSNCDTHTSTATNT